MNEAIMTREELDVKQLQRVMHREYQRANRDKCRQYQEKYLAKKLQRIRDAYDATHTAGAFDALEGPDRTAVITDAITHAITASASGK